ncbi:hypothetical protein SCHPADRAFT_891320 [Schizopora paradoxa]|uniref:DUF6533 domain-containing protein n=1 Tax=Schizopora paradoxa TaxID=27342 RepID=A0A0H2RIW3_9AGAM|nr:hypothetical protein SCHPADRAFT_891320 [Schizopora paradoxa]
MIKGIPVSVSSTNSISEENLRFMFIQAYIGFACYTILIYDILLTLSDEIRYMWQWRKGLYPYLIFLNRYIPPFAFMVQLISYQSPSFTPSRFALMDFKVCMHFVRYEGAIHCIIVSNAGLIMMIRTVLLYGKNRWVAGILGILWSLQIGTLAFFLSGGQKGPEGCVLVYKESLGVLDVLSYIFALIFDTVVLGMTIFRVHGLRQVLDQNAAHTPVTGRGPHNRTAERSGSLPKHVYLNTLMQQQTVVYFCVISLTNLVFSIMMATSPLGIRSVAGQAAELLTVTITSRLCIDIRKAGENPSVVSDGANRFARTRTASPMIFSENEEIEMAEFQRETLGGARDRCLQQETVDSFFTAHEEAQRYAADHDRRHQCINKNTWRVTKIQLNADRSLVEGSTKSHRRFCPPVPSELLVETQAARNATIPNGNGNYAPSLEKTGGCR